MRERRVGPAICYCTLLRDHDEGWDAELGTCWWHGKEERACRQGSSCKVQPRSDGCRGKEAVPLAAGVMGQRS